MWNPFRTGSNHPTERRRYGRLPSRSSRAVCSAVEIELCDVTAIGIGVSAPRNDGLEPGKRHLVIVEDDRGATFETLAEVRWVAGPSKGGRFRAGLAFVDILRDDPGGHWTGIAADPEIEAGESHQWNP